MERVRAAFRLFLLLGHIMSILLVILGIICLFIFILPLPGIVFNIGSALGISLGCALILYGLFRQKLPRKVHKAVHILTALALGVLLFFGCLLFYGTKKQPEDGHPVTMIILGCRVNGSEPSLMLWNRINTAKRYLEEHPEVKAICSGGQGDDELIAEGQSIYDKLVLAGIDPERLFIEDRSSSTKENIAFSKELIEKEDLAQDVILVTNDYHCFRAIQLAEKQGLHAYARPGRTALYLLPTYFLRECCGIAYLWVFG